MKLIHKKLTLGKKPTNQEVKEFSQKKSEIRRRLLDNKQYLAFGLLMELLSHQQDFETSRDYLMSLVGCTSVDTYNGALAALRQYGHLRIEGDNRNSTYYIYEYPEQGMFPIIQVKKTKSGTSNLKKKEEEKPAESIFFTEQELKEIKKQGPKKYEVIIPKINLII